MKLSEEILLLQEQVDKCQKYVDILDNIIDKQFPIYNNIHKKLANSLKTTNIKLNEFFYALYKRENESKNEAGKRLHRLIPVATDFMRLCQLEGLFLMKKLDELLMRMNIPYNIDYGNLLGYVRTGDTIPWDDDMDIDILIEDAIKVTEMITQFEDFKEFEIRCDKSGRMRFAAIGYPLFVDLIICVKVKNMKEFEANKALFNRLSISRDKESLLTIYNNGSDDALSFINSIYSELINGFVNIENSDNENDNESFFVRTCLLFMTKPNPTSIKNIFPLRRGIYDGIEVNIPNNPDTLLLQRYGDYWYLPSDTTHRRSSSKNIKKIMEFSDFIKSNDEKYYFERILPVLAKMEE